MTAPNSTDRRPEITHPKLTHATNAPVVDNLNIQTAGPRGPALLRDIWLIEKLAQRRMA